MTFTRKNGQRQPERSVPADYCFGAGFGFWFAGAVFGVGPR